MDDDRSGVERFNFPAGFGASELHAFMVDAVVAASEMADRLVDLGFTERQAGSLAAHFALDAGWFVAANGSLSEGIEPQPERFVDAARAAISRLDMDALRKRRASIAEAAHG